jgi:Cu+-exporting ATPase
MRNLEGVTSMFLGGFCGQMGVAGWILMGLFWVTFLGLVLWALSRLFAGPRGDDGEHEDVDDLDQQSARGQINLSEYRTLREELVTSAGSNRSHPHSVRFPATIPVVEVGRVQEKEHHMSKESPTVTDPICGMSVAPATAAASVEHEGHTYYFCGKGCAKSFSADPGKYANVARS